MSSWRHIALLFPFCAVEMSLWSGKAISKETKYWSKDGNMRRTLGAFHIINSLFFKLILLFSALASFPSRLKENPEVNRSTRIGTVFPPGIYIREANTRLLRLRLLRYILRLFKIYRRSREPFLSCEYYDLRVRRGVNIVMKSAHSQWKLGENTPGLLDMI